ncbi:polysaccharide pyruvyl transferase family protein [Arthrobacter sp. zg-Y1110]|uniref:polysaccharide pyruvyl transferase family protein n=1 Tax=Arthrobacter sp. zg-Y1110 TaxID=2886932 RepID=UPI001D14508F|nr:polysaccharide pyruvyl transferase family protein [Arthrobacter sp. zg-Y1110]MCC3292213.1 polysaccharide pyruvyl transferase family protein [Arthrobacter sp. zg-Y1110]UWX85299.1 polysaccharide pyruvyl transferase family protein [Arthrobacter sp. zg-Y1110]
MTRVAVLADVGQHVYHVGDEAMGLAAADELTRRGFDVVLLSRDPDQTQDGYGHPAVSTLEFPWSPAEREDYLRRIQAHLAGASSLPESDPALALREQLASVDAVLIAGGGNLNSRFGWLLYERAAVAAIARSLGKPVVVSGQTLGPVLTARDAQVLAEMLQGAQLVGVRESTSAGIARELGVDAVQGLDDASFLADPALPDGGAAVQQDAARPVPRYEAPAGDYVAVTFAPGGDEDFRSGLAAALDQLHAKTQLPAVFIPHMGVPGNIDADAGMHAEIAALMDTPAVLVPVVEAREAARLTRGASLVVTTRYHPAVFALSAGVAAVALSVEAYSDARLRGAMENWGMDDFVLSRPALQEDLLDEALLEAWERRAETASHLKAVLEFRTRDAGIWWDRVAAVLQADTSAAAVSAAPGATGLSPSARLEGRGEWAAAETELRRRFYPQSLLAARLAAEDERVQSFTAPIYRALEEERTAHQRLAGSRTVQTALGLHSSLSKFRRHRA